MPFCLGRVWSVSRIRLAASLVIAIGSVGCNSGQSSNQALERQISDNPQYKKESVVPFAGAVTIDGQPPGNDYKLFVILNDPKHLDANAHAAAPKLYAVCDSEGKFFFGTYDRKDGVVVGNYVMTFVGLRAPGTGAGKTGKAFLSGMSRGPRNYKPPDALKNLYNDPDVNVKEERFKVNAEPPGKTDYEFDLHVAGKDAAPIGPNAVTALTLPY
jgi:hypothetical protein